MVPLQLSFMAKRLKINCSSEDCVLAAIKSSLQALGLPKSFCVDYLIRKENEDAPLDNSMPIAQIAQCNLILEPRTYKRINVMHMRRVRTLKLFPHTRAGDLAVVAAKVFGVREFQVFSLVSCETGIHFPSDTYLFYEGGVQPLVFLRGELVPSMKKTKVFGGALHDVFAAGGDYYSIPVFIPLILEKIEQNIDVEGIYRVSGSKDDIDKLVSVVESNDPSALMESIESANVHCLVCLIKLFFRSLKDPIVPMVYRDEFFAVENETDEFVRLSMLKSCIFCLPTPHFLSMMLFVFHLLSVSEHSASNRMTISNIAKVCSPCFFRFDSSENMIAFMPTITKFLEDVIKNNQFFFGSNRIFEEDGRLVIANDGEKRVYPCDLVMS